MSRRYRRLLFCGIAPAVLTAGLSLGRPSMFTHLEYGAYDVMVRSMPLRAPSDRVLIVDVDERSLTAMGQWPWSHDQVADLVSRVRTLGASVVALDIIFAEPERYGAGAHPDARLIATIAGGRVLLGYAFRFDEAATASATCVPHPFALALVKGAHDDDYLPYFRAIGAVCNLSALTQAADASGFLNAAPDTDGILRRVPLLLEFKGRTYPALALATVAAALATDSATLRVANVNASTLRLSAASPAASSDYIRDIPLDGKANMLVRFRGPKRTLRYVSAADVLEGKADAARFRDKLVFIGTSALGTREVVATPLDTLFTGVEVQATVADNLLQADYIERPEYGRILETLLLITLCLASALAIGRWGVLWGALTVAGMLVALWGGSLWLMSGAGILLSPLYPTLGVAATLMVMTGAVLTLERRRADRAGEDIATSQRLMVQTLLSLTEIRDAETGEHSRRIQLYARLLALELANHPRFRAYLTCDRIELLSTLAVLHDIGKVGIPDRVLNKAGALTDEEMAEMRRHPAYGRDVILKAEHAVGISGDRALALAKDIVYTHHEKWDGTGYPEGLRGRDIPIPGRLIAVVDVYDALVTRRPYRKAMTHEEGMALIVNGSGTHFDPDVVEGFVRVSPAFRRLSAQPDERVA